jgi:hypothetical protein
MSKLIPTILIATSFVIGFTQSPKPLQAGTCASKCGAKPLQFTPGQHIRLEIFNATSGLVRLQRPSNSDPIPLSPGKQLTLEDGEGTEPNVSLIFWDETGLPLKAVLSKPNFGTLKVEIRPGGRPPGDRSVYILNDGRVNLF